MLGKCKPAFPTHKMMKKKGKYFIFQFPHWITYHPFRECQFDFFNFPTFFSYKVHFKTGFEYGQIPASSPQKRLEFFGIRTLIVKVEGLVC